MADQSKDIPNQRGTSSGEIGENPVQAASKQQQPHKDVPDPASTEPPEDASKPPKAHPDDAKG